MKSNRLYHLKDAHFLEYSEVVAATLPADLPDFTAFDATITGDYVTQIQQSIDKAKAISPDEIVKSEMKEETQKVDKAMEDCDKAYQNLAFFVRKVFKGNAAVQNQFGRNDIQKARSSQPVMVVFMENLAKTAAKYTDELTQAGCPATLITGLADKAAALHDANIAQEQFKSERILNTQSRIELFNNVYALLQNLHNVAMIIYRDNPEKLSIYTMPQRPKKASADPETPETPAEG